MSQSPLSKNYIQNLKKLSNLVRPTQQRLKQDFAQKILNFNDAFKDKKNTQTYNNIICTKIINQSQRQHLLLCQSLSGHFSIHTIHTSKMKKSISSQRLLNSLYLFPSQIIMKCQYDLENNFHKSMIVYAEARFLKLAFYCHGQLSGQQLSFDIQTMILVKSVYDKGILKEVTDYCLNIEDQKVTHHATTNKFKIKLQNFIKSKQLCEQIYKLTQGNFQWLKPIQTKFQNTIYYGQLNEQTNLPLGFGLLINKITIDKKVINQYSESSHKFDQVQQSTKMEIYSGYFQNGLLNTIGSIWFKNNHTYFGEFQNGNCLGYGQFYTPYYHQPQKHNNSCFYYKHNKTACTQQQFIQSMKKIFFYVNKQSPFCQNFHIVQNQYLKLQTIYGSTYKPLEQNQQKTSNQQSKRKLSKISDRTEQANFNNPQYQFKRIYTESATQKSKDSPISRSKTKIQTKKVKQYPNQNKDFFEQVQTSKNHQKWVNSNIKQQPIPELMLNFVKKDKQRQSDTKKLMRISQQPQYSTKSGYQNVNQSRQIDLGCQQITQQRHTSHNKSNIQNYNDYMQKQYPIQNVRNFTFPQYFITDDNTMPRNYDHNTRKLIFEEKSTVRKNHYYQPNHSQNKIYQFGNDQNSYQEHVAVQNFQKLVNKGRIKGIFNNTKPNQY